MYNIICASLAIAATSFVMVKKKTFNLMPFLCGMNVSLLILSVAKLFM